MVRLENTPEERAVRRLRSMEKKMKEEMKMKMREGRREKWNER